MSALLLWVAYLLGGAIILALGTAIVFAIMALAVGLVLAFFEWLP